MRLQNPNSGKRILDARISDPNSWVQFFGPIFSSKRGPLKNSPSRNSPPKIHLPKFNPEIGPKNSHCTFPAIFPGRSQSSPREPPECIPQTATAFSSFLFLLAVGVFLVIVEFLRLQSIEVLLRCTSHCKQRNSTVRRKAPTVSRKAPTVIKKLPNITVSKKAHL